MDLKFDFTTEVTEVGDLHTYFFNNCPSCGKRNQIFANLVKLNRWQSGGELIQNVWPNLSAEERELMLTGFHSDCWDEMFAEDEYEESLILDENVVSDNTPEAIFGEDK